jgi:hypothetical protein
MRSFCTSAPAVGGNQRPSPSQIHVISPTIRSNKPEMR